jgi:hypothetical protein
MGGLEHGSQKKMSHTSFFSGTINLRFIMFSLISVGWVKNITHHLKYESIELGYLMSFGRQ